MASMRDIKRRKGSIQSTQQITKAIETCFYRKTPESQRAGRTDRSLFSVPDLIENIGLRKLFFQITREEAHLQSDKIEVFRTDTLPKMSEILLGRQVINQRNCPNASNMCRTSLISTNQYTDRFQVRPGIYKVISPLRFKAPVSYGQRYFIPRSSASARLTILTTNIQGQNFWTCIFFLENRICNYSSL